MSEINNKPWERPWSPEEMISNASTWSLAGDAGLLNYLQEFSEKMISNIKATNDRLNDLIEDTNETSIALNNATNEFMGLRNTQFIESRVYDDDETLPQKPKPEPEKPHKQTDIDRLDEMKKAILNGLEIIDKYYEKVEIPESDSDDDIDEPSIVYRPIDPYMDRPLPYVIGTAEWHKYWHVGLAHSSSSSETENDDEEFSESDMEAVLPQRESKVLGVSDTESDDLPKGNVKVAKPVANSTFNDNTNRNMFESSSDSETGSLPPQVNTINNNFAEELAAKLGKVEAVKEPEVNTKPIKKPTNISAGLFSDEPPPLDEDDIFVNKNMKSGLFSGGEGLFDDNNDDTDFWNTKTSTITKITPVVDPKLKSITVDDKNIFNDTKINKPTSQQKPLGLFDDEEDDLFSKASIAQSKKSILTPFKTAPPLFSEEPPALEPPITNETKRKKPIGGVSMLGSGNSITEHFDKIIKKRAPSTSDSDSEKDIHQPVSKPSQVIETSKSIPQTPIEPPKIITQVGSNKIDSIFDDNSPLFTDDIFGETSTNNTSSLFDSKTPEKVEPQKPKLKEKPILSVSQPSSVAPKPQMLFDDEDLFSKPPELPKSEKKSSKNVGLFDQDDDLFSFSNNTNSLAPKASKSINLFDPNPPELDESDAKSDKSQISLENEPSTFDTLNTGRVSLFDNEPPLLSNESSGIVKDQSTRLESSDSSFLPTMTSSRRHSTDFFQENQSDDSLFITKSKPLTDTNLLGKSDLSLISELDTPTKIEITPSGVESSLFDQSSIENQSTDSDMNRSSLDPLGSFESSLPKEVSSKNQYLPENKLSDQPATVEPKIISLFGESDNKIPKIAAKPKPKIASLLQDSDSDDDLFSNKSTTSKHSDILSNAPSKPLKTKHIFEDDLFHGPNVAGVPEVDLFTKNTRIESEVAKQHEHINKKFDYEDNLKIADKTDPKKPLNISNKDCEEVDDQISSSTSPGKLKLNFNINVAALLPGASPPRRHNLEKSTSFDSSENTQKASPIENIRKSVEILPTQQKTPDNSLSYNESTETDSILPSVAKERARIQVKRRPSTRKARHEAIRKSAIDLNFEDQIPEIDNTLAQNFNNTSDEQANKPSSKTILNISNLDIENPLQSSDQKTNPLSPSTDEEDVFSMPQESFDSQDSSSSLFDAKQSNIDTKQIECLASTVKTKQTSSIFSSSDSENDLFGSTESELKKPELKDDLFKPVAEAVVPVAEAVVPVAVKSNMLQWDDNLSEEEDDIFSSKKLPLKSSVLKKSLFEDDDEDDIFKEATSKASSSKSQSSYSKVKKIGMTRVKKLTADVGIDIDDPLDALKN